MRIKLLHHGSEWIAGDFEPPPPLAKKKHLTAWHIQASADKSTIAAKLQPGCAIWDAAGKLLQHFPRGGDVFLGWSRDEFLLLDNTFGDCKDQKGVRHQVRRLQLGTWRGLASGDLCVPWGGVEYLIVDHRRKTAVATWREQSQWGYVGVDLATLAQTDVALTADGPTLSPPAFSPDDAMIVACHYTGNRWWSDDPDDWYAPSPGGERKVGTISVHYLATGRISFHDVFVDLPAGWLPDRPEEPDWSMLWGPEFDSVDAFHIWLPDETKETLTLPLPSRIVIKRGLSTTRAWED